MGFPGRVYGWFGDEKVAQSTKINGFPLGIRMELPDGREFVQAKAGTAATLDAGTLVQAPNWAGTAAADTAASQGNLTCASAVVGATSLTITAGGTTAFVKDEFADGYVVVASSAGTGIGHIYKIKLNNSAAAGATCLFKLYENDSVKVAIEGGTTKVGVRTNEYHRVIVMTADTVYTGPPAGVPPVAVSAGFYCWLQRKGVAPLKSGATVLIAGEPVVASTATVAGVGHIMAGSAQVDIKSKVPIGYAMATALSAGFATVFLTLP
mgnify:CR=1 FL=1